jgi:hypothetical protein
MVIKSRENLYRGVNAHLHSILQAPSGGWEQFHTAHIIFLGTAIRPLLPEGYAIFPERSMQIREITSPVNGDQDIRKRPFRPDTTIYQTSTVSGQAAISGATSVPTITMPTIETLPEDNEVYLTSLIIREVSDSGVGKPITCIEVLSPTNKPHGTGYIQYREKRTVLLRSGLVLVEIDYLHETPTVLPKLPDYSTHEENSFPYTIAIHNPHPDLEGGKTAIYGIYVDDPLPTVSIPLKDADRVILNFGEVYNQTYESFSFGEMVDYSQPPVHFDRYSADDRERILARMKAATNQ